MKATKKSWIAKRGDLLGRTPCRYRVADVRDAEVELEKADSATCPGQPVRRVVRLGK